MGSILQRPVNDLCHVAEELAQLINKQLGQSKEITLADLRRIIDTDCSGDCKITNAMIHKIFGRYLLMEKNNEKNSDTNEIVLKVSGFMYDMVQHTYSLRYCLCRRGS